MTNLSRIEQLTLRGKTYAVRHWGPQDTPTMFFLHGWLDCSASFQFVVDALRQSWHVIAPDWRGHGGSHRTGESYLFVQLLADLDALLDQMTPAEPVRIVAHSLGGNIATVYAGLRPERVRCCVNLEGLAPVPGLSKGLPADRLVRWLDGLHTGFHNRPYRDLDALVQRLREANPRLTEERARFLAQEFSRPIVGGGLEFSVDPFEYARMPQLGHDQIVASAWPRIVAPVLVMTAEESHIYRAFASEPGLLERRLGLIRQLERVHIDDAGHNLHHDQPEIVAMHIERFLLAH